MHSGDEGERRKWNESRKKGNRRKWSERNGRVEETKGRAKERDEGKSPERGEKKEKRVAWKKKIDLKRTGVS